MKFGLNKALNEMSKTHAMTMLALLKTVHPLNFFLFNKQLK